MNTKEELLALLRVCNADPCDIDAVEMAYEMGYKAGKREAAYNALVDKLKEVFAAGFDSAPE